MPPYHLITKTKNVNTMALQPQKSIIMFHRYAGRRLWFGEHVCTHRLTVFTLVVLCTVAVLCIIQYQTKIANQFTWLIYFRSFRHAYNDLYYVVLAQNINTTVLFFTRFLYIIKINLQVNNGHLLHHNYFTHKHFFFG